MKFPSTKQVIIAVDIGTGSSRALLVDDKLNILSIHSETNHLIEPSSGWAEQNPNEILENTLTVIRQAVNHAKSSTWNICGLCFSNAVSSLMALDQNDRPLGNALIWADSRAQEEVTELSSHARVLYQKTGTPLHASYWLPKLRWLQKNRPEIFSKAVRWMCVKDYVIWYLTAEFVTDFSNAASSGMLDLQTMQWETLCTSIVGLSVDSFPSIQPTTYIINHLRAEVSNNLGLPQNTNLILGCGDGVLANMGSGVIHPGQLATTIGSSGACRAISFLPVLYDQSMQFWSYPLINNFWVIGGAENSGGLVVDWFQKTFLPPSQSPFNLLAQATETIPPGSDGLIFLPYLFGERAPIWNEYARGTLIGLENRHTLSHIAHAVFEGTIFALFDVYQSLCPYLPETTEIRVSGGYTRSPSWLKLQANIFGKEISVLENHECSALGAAILGFYTLGFYANLEYAVSQIKIKEWIDPDPKQFSIYQDLYPLYHQAYTQLKIIYQGLHEFRTKVQRVDPIIPVQ